MSEKALDIAVIGGGAAGFFGAIAAAEAQQNVAVATLDRPKHRITIYEKGRQVLGKVRISGGGRCNVTHACFDNRQLVKHYPRGERWLRPLLTQFDAAATVRWFDSHGVRLKTEPDGRMFPTTDSSETIIHCLTDTARRLGIQVRTGAGIETLRSEHNKWHLRLLTGEDVVADRVLIATGGYPQLPSYGWLPAQAEPLVSPVPSLFTFNVPNSPLLPLAGVSVPNAEVSVAGTKLAQRGPLLITHWGFSGPALLRLSAWGARALADLNYRFTLRINWTPTLSDETLRTTLQQFRQENGKKLVITANPFGLPARLWQALTAQAGATDTSRWAELPGKVQNRLAELLTNSRYDVVGKSTFKDEFVTCGGVALGSVCPNTLESRAHPGLFFAGEVLDVDGITGGFNFQHAWTTGYVAGQGLVSSGQ